MSQPVRIDSVVKRYGDFTAVNKVSLQVREGEFFTLLGPSGCGKTTLLRMIAGFNSIDEGTISFGDQVINDIPSHKRDIGMVFQNYAIFPHMTVYQNVVYGLKNRKVPKDEIVKRAEEVMHTMQIYEYRDRQPNQMSGGQQQRVALARAIIIKPRVLLMDEPLSNLDAKLRVEMRNSIRHLQKSLGITTIYVTHDQEEALAISDRIAVMHNGIIEQLGNPIEIYAKPTNRFVADFIGISNFIQAENGKDGLRILGRNYSGLTCHAPLDKALTISIRPEHARIGRTDKENALPGKISIGTFLGDYISYEIKLDDGPMIFVNEYAEHMKELYQAGDSVYVELPPWRAMIFETDTGNAVPCQVAQEP